MASDIEAKLRELHRHVCAQDGELLECEANEDDPHETGVCGPWDALRDAAGNAYLDAAEMADGYPIATEPGWHRTVEVVGKIVDAIRARAARLP